MSNPIEEKLMEILHNVYGNAPKEAVLAIICTVREIAPEAYTITNPYPEMEDTNTHYQLGWNDCRHVLLERLGTNA